MCHTAGEFCAGIVVLSSLFVDANSPVTGFLSRGGEAHVPAGFLSFEDDRVRSACTALCLELDTVRAVGHLQLTPRAGRAAGEVGVMCEAC